MPIIVYNRKNDDYSHYENNYPCYRGGSVLANPYTHLPLKKTKALYKTRTKEEAIERYSTYFDLMYGSNQTFKKLIDEIYIKYINGENIYLECYCAPSDCHCDIIKKKIEQRYLKEKIKEIKKQK